MAWYQRTSGTFTNNSDIVTDSGAAFIANVSVGEAVIGPDGRPYEIESVDSNTQLTLIRPYLGSTASSQMYSILPTQSALRDLTAQTATLIANFTAVRDGPGQGMFNDGTVSAPGIRSITDQDTGMYWAAANVIGFGTGGTGRAFISSNGLSFALPGSSVPYVRQKAFGYSSAYQALVLGGQGSTSVAVGVDVSTIAGGNFPGAGKDLIFPTDGSVTTVNSGGTDFHQNVIRFAGDKVGIGGTPATKLDINGAVNIASTQSLTWGGAYGANIPTLVGVSGAGSYIAFYPAGSTSGEKVRIDANGNLLVGQTSYPYNAICKNVTNDTGSAVLETFSTTGVSTAIFYGVSAYGVNSANAAMKCGYDNVTGASIRTGGTINASGSDYAEYMRKALLCGTILKGQVCGINADGELIDRWSLAVSGYVVKSTKPSIVGGDAWGSEAVIGARPVQPVLTLPEYDGPAEPEPVPPLALSAPEEPGDAPEAPNEPVREENESDIEWAVRVNAFVISHMAYLHDAALHQEMVDSYPDRLAAYEATVEAHAIAMTAYETALTAYEAAQETYAEAIETAENLHEIALEAWTEADTDWQAAHEVERAKVDRIAFCGQVPCNVTGPFTVGDYIVASEGPNDTIIAVAVSAEDITDAQYRNRVGRVWGVTEETEDWSAGLAWINVQYS